MLVGDRDQRLVITLACIQRYDPALQVRGLSGWSPQRHLQCATGALDQQCAQVPIAAATTVAQARLAAGARLTRCEPEPGAELAAVAEDGRVRHRGRKGAGGEHTDTQHFTHAMCRSTVAACAAISTSQRSMRAWMAANCSRASISSARTGGGTRSSLLKPGSALNRRSLDCAIVIPNSASSPRKRLISAVRSSLKPDRARCHDRIACCSTVLIGTKRMVGWRAATAMASASLPSFLPPCRNATTNSAAISRALCPRPAK